MAQIVDMMAQIVDMANLEARLTTLGSQVEHLAQILPRPGVSSEESTAEGWLDELNDFTADIKQARTQLSSISRREEEMTKREELLEQKAAKMTKRGELLEQRKADITKGQELLEHRAAEIAKGEELAEQKTRAINEREALIQRKTLELQESIKIHVASQADMAKEVETLTTREAEVTEAENALEKRSEIIEQRRKADEEMIRSQEDKLNRATESMTGAAEELRNATETGSKAREALQQVLVRQNASLLNDNTAKRGLGPSSSETPFAKRRQFVRGGSAGAAEVLANVETPGLLVNTIQTFGSANERRRPLFETPRTTSGGSGRLASFTGPMTASRSGVSSPALNQTPATGQDSFINPSPNTIVPPGQGDASVTEPSGLSMASDYVQNVWRQIEFPADWTTADSAKLLDKLNEAKERKAGKNNRYWPQQAMDMGSKSNQPYCLLRDLKKQGMAALQDPQPCESHASDGLMCIHVSYSTASPGEYDPAATDKRWHLEKRQ